MFGYHTLVRRQRLPGAPEDVFPFFADAGNLEAITPPWLAFRITTPRPIEMRLGTLIEYRLRLHGLPIRWLTQIADWEPGVRFVDTQIRGPYALWHHTHEFEADGGHTLMRDTVRYALPLGPLGRIAREAFVKRDLERIFDYRAAALSRSQNP
jgi:ligand-binding SRPBCC domain-containing protein